jgi:hypothetical protein
MTGIGSSAATRFTRFSLNIEHARCRGAKIRMA